jgi:dihydroceramidase
MSGIRADPMQLIDELSMIYTTCLMCYASFAYAKPQATRITLGVFLTALAIFITLYYHYLQDPVFHQAAYAILTVIVVFHSMYTMEVTLRPKWKKTREEDRLARQRNGRIVPGKERQERENQRDLRILRTMWYMVAYGLSMFIGGFVIWSLDTAYCSRIRVWRRHLGLPWGLILEGHGWWSVTAHKALDAPRSSLYANTPQPFSHRHLMTGIGAYLYIIWGIWLRHILNNEQDNYELVWEKVWHAPEIVRVQKPYTNGTSKKAS